MRKSVIVAAALVIVSYLIGVESEKARDKDYEDPYHRMERWWKSPEARKWRRREKKKARKAIEKARKRISR